MTCNLDSDCPWESLDYIEGSGKPTNQGMVCCATFPRETWNEASQQYEKQSSKHCYSKTILRNESEFNYYKQAYCDNALMGMYSSIAAVAITLVTLMSF